MTFTIDAKTTTQKMEKTPTPDELKSEIENGPLNTVLAPYWADVFGLHHKPELDWRIGILKPDAAFEIRKRLIADGRSSELGWDDQWSYELIVAAKGMTPDKAAPKYSSTMKTAPSDSLQSMHTKPDISISEDRKSIMPKRHGIFSSIPANVPKGTRLTSAQSPVFRYGIWQIFEAMQSGPFLPFSDRSKTANLEYHFRVVSQRFIYSLQHLNNVMQQIAASFECNPYNIDLERMCLEAGCHADHVLTYLNTIVDDIAQVTILATGVSPSKHNQRMESMGDLKHESVVNTTAQD